MQHVAIASPDRAAYEAIVAQCEKAGLKNALPYPGYLRSETLLGAGQSIQFNLLANQTADGQPISGNEQRLQQNDAFFVSRIACMIYKAAATAPGAASTEANRSTARLQQFPNTQVFTTNAPAVVAYFNGKLTIKQNDVIYCRDLDMWSMQYADTAQQGQLVFTGSNTDANAIDYARSFQTAIDPMFRLNGQSNIEANILLPTSQTFFQAGLNESLYAVLYLKGWRVQNAGVARTAKG